MPNAKNLSEVYQRSFHTYENLPFLGSIVDGNPKRTIESLTYGEVFSTCKELGSGLINLELLYRAEKEFREYDLNLIGVMTKNRKEWVMLDIANVLFKNVMVPMYENSELKLVDHILNQTGIKSILCTEISIKTLLQLENTYNLKNLIVADPISPE